MKTKKIMLGLGVAVALQGGIFASAISIYSFIGATTNITLNPGTYIITAYGAQGGRDGALSHAGGLGAEISAEFTFPTITALTLLVGGAGNNAYGSAAGGGGGGSFVVHDTTPMVIAGGGGGSSYSDVGGDGIIGTGGDGSGGNHGDGTYCGGAGGGLNGDGIYGGYWAGRSGISFFAGGDGGNGGRAANGPAGTGGFGGGGGGGAGFDNGVGGGGGGGGYSGGSSGSGIFNTGGGGGGSYINASGIVLAEFSGVASPDNSPNGEIVILAIPEPGAAGFIALGMLGAVFIFRWKKARGFPLPAQKT